LSGGAPPDPVAETLARPQVTTFDGACGCRIIETHIWAVREGCGVPTHII
jgi:hypothetical protein